MTTGRLQRKAGPRTRPPSVSPRAKEKESDRAALDFLDEFGFGPAAGTSVRTPESPAGSDTYLVRAWAVVRRIPYGRVATYGQVARLAGRCTARMAGYALAALPAGEDAPWHRVVNREGRISLRSDGQANVDQRTLLEREGIRFDPDGRIDLGVFRWLE